MASIFVSIPSFRDPEAQHTIECLFAQARDPARVFVGVLHQIERADHDELFKVPFSRPEQTRCLVVDAAESTGPCRARAIIIEQLYRGEDFFLSFDSHMRVIEHWDEVLIDQWTACGEGEKAVITTYPAGYEFGARRDGWRDAVTDSDPRPPMLCFSHFGDEGMMRFKGRRLKQVQDAPIPALFAVSGFFFARGHVTSSTPYRTSLNLDGLFFGEETLLTVRLWCDGYRFFCPGRHIAFHLWDRSYRQTFFSKGTSSKHASLERVQALLLLAGSQASPADYWSMAGIDFERKTASEAAKRGGLEAECFLETTTVSEQDVAQVMALLRGIK